LAGPPLPPPPRHPARGDSTEQHRQADANRVAPGQLEHFQRSRSPALGHLPGRCKSDPSTGAVPARSRGGNCERCGRWAIWPVNRQHHHLEYETGWTAGWPGINGRPSLQDSLSTIAGAHAGGTRPQVAAQDPTPSRRRCARHFHIAQALRQTLPDGDCDAGSAVRWQRRCRLEQDVPQQIQPHRDGVKIA